MEYIIETVEAPAGFYTSLYVTGVTNWSEIAKFYAPGNWREPTTARHLLGSPGRGVWSTTKEASMISLRKGMVKEIRSLEKNGDLRPSQVRRLELLKSGLEFFDRTSEVIG